MANDLGDWYKTIPQITRFWFTGSVVLPLLGRFGLVSAAYMILSWDAVFRYFQIWRPFSAIFYYPITPMTGFHYLMTLYFLYSYSTRLESGLFDGRRADFLFLLLVNWLVLLLVSVFTSIPLLMEPLVFSVLYIWCQVNKDAIVQFWFGTQFKAMYMPWILLAFNMIIRGGRSRIQIDLPFVKEESAIEDQSLSASSSSSLSSSPSFFSSTPSSQSSSASSLVVSSGFVEIVGILVGHVYYFLKYRYPVDYGGTDYLQTPQILYKYLPNRQGGVSGFGMPPANRYRQPDDAPRAGGHQWGRGNLLGRD